MATNENKEYQDLMGSSLDHPVAVEPAPVARPHRVSRDQKTKAATIIARVWRRYSMIKTFQWLKENVQKSERSIGADILKRLNPREAQLLKDPTSNVRIRFR